MFDEEINTDEKKLSADQGSYDNRGADSAQEAISRRRSGDARTSASTLHISKDEEQFIAAPPETKSFEPESSLLKDSIGLETRWLRDEAEKASPVIEEVQTTPGAHPLIDKHRNFSLEVDDDITNGVVYTISGCIVKVHSDYVLLYAPIPKIWKTLVTTAVIKNSPYLRAGHEIVLGKWMSVDAVPRHPQTYDETYPPRYSHIATSKPVYFDIKSLIPTWEQRFFNGVYQIRLTFDLKNPDNIAVEKDNSGNPHYLLTSTSDVVAVVPAYRIASLVNDAVEKNRLRFWVNRGHFLFEQAVHLFEETEIEEILPNGSIRRHVSPLLENSAETDDQLEANTSITENAEPNANFLNVQGPAIVASISDNGVNMDICTENVDDRAIQLIISTMLKLEDITVQKAIRTAGLIDEYGKVKCWVDNLLSTHTMREHGIAS